MPKKHYSLIGSWEKSMQKAWYLFLILKRNKIADLVGEALELKIWTIDFVCEKGKKYWKKNEPEGLVAEEEESPALKSSKPLKTRSGKAETVSSWSRLRFCPAQEPELEEEYAEEGELADWITEPATKGGGGAPNSGGLLWLKFHSPDLWPDTTLVSAVTIADISLVWLIYPPENMIGADPDNR